MATSARIEELKSKFDENPRRYFAPLANELRKLGDLARAIEICRSHLPAQPGHVSGHIVLAQALHEAGELDEARKEFEAALELDPENLIALRFMGDIARAKGSYDSARAWYERVLDSDPRNEEITRYLRELTESARSSDPVASIHDIVRDAGATPVVSPAVDAVAFDAPARTPASEGEVPDLVAPTADFFYNVGGNAQSIAHEEADSAPAIEGGRPEALAGQDAQDAYGAFPPDQLGGDVSSPETSPAEQDESMVVSGDADMFSFGPSPSPAGSTSVSPDFGALDLSIDDGDDALPVDEPGPAASNEAPDAPAHAEGYAELDFGAAWSPEAEAREKPAVPEEPGPSYEPTLEVEPTWRAGTPASVEYSDLAAVPEDWFAESGPASSIPEAHDATTPPAEPVAADADSLDSWFDEPASVSSGEAPADEAVEPTAAAFPLEADAPAGGVIESWQSDEVIAKAAESGGIASADSIEYAAFADDDGAKSRSFHDAGYEAPAEAVLGEPPASELADVAAEPHAQDEVGDVDMQSGVEAEGPADAAAMRWEATTRDHAYQEPAPASVDDEAAWYGWGVAGAESVDETRSTEASEQAEASLTDEVTEDARGYDAPALEAVPDELSTYAAANTGASDDEDESVAADSVASREPIAESGDAMPEPIEAQAEPAPSAFVSETLAELYLQQGFHEEALSIYRRLAERNPFDEQVRQRIAALERGEASDVLSPVDVDSTERTALSRVSVRTFFGALARRQPSGGGPGSRGPGSDPDARDGTYGVTGVGSDSAQEHVPVDFSGGGEGADAPSYQASASALAQMFSAASPSASDVSAAAALASAFAVGHGAPSPPGRPSRMADRELSLDHLFREPGTEQGGAVSMDDFYSLGSATQPADTPADGSVSDERDSEITQFSAWLEGLKKK